MNDEEMRERLRAAVADEPPLGFDPDEVVTRTGTRRRRRLQAGGSAVAVVAVAAVTIGALTSAGPGEGLGRAAAGPGTADSATSGRAAEPERAEICRNIDELPAQPGGGEPTGRGFAPGSRTFPGADETMKDIRAAMPDVLAEHFPDIDLTEEGPSGPMETVNCPPELGSAYVDRSTGDRVVVSLVRFGHEGPVAEDVGWRSPSAPGELVATRNGANGSIVRVYRAEARSEEFPTADEPTVTAVHYRTDGLVLRAQSHPSDTLTREALIGLVTDARLNLTVG
ncbi:hypothetical protein LY13_002426 [Prauserella aidingensis]|uniref:hypothetical protein n=1 Tax=Prauserella aidingensis TaxID=387890 RepID=UPI0020A24F96|nr:hypothetical protein [Prauserella aidingensis]MCP2253672.1 hypothetical protein [Prauserella aidingensis]